jgi:hypothetical protein
LLNYRRRRRQQQQPEPVLGKGSPRRRMSPKMMNKRMGMPSRALKRRIPKQTTRRSTLVRNPKRRLVKMEKQQRWIQMKKPLPMQSEQRMWLSLVKTLPPKPQAARNASRASAFRARSEVQVSGTVGQ